MSRRAFLALGSAAALSGCGVQATEQRRGPGTSATGKRADREVLAGLAAVKAQAVGVYTAFADLAGGRASDVLAHEREHLRRLERAGAGPVNTFTVSSDSADRAVARRQVIDAEYTLIAAYVDALPKLSDAKLRQLVTEMLAADAQHLALLEDISGEAFVYGERRI